MNLSYLSILAAFTAAMTFSPVAVPAQATALAASSISNSMTTEVQRAELDYPATSSSSDSSLIDAPVQSVISTQARPALRPETSSRPFSGIAVGVKFGVAGVGFDVATPLVRGRLNLRSGASFFSYNTTLTEDSVDIAGSIKFQSAAAMVDWFPFHGGFRISGGATTYNNTGMNASLAVPAGQSSNLGGTTYYSQPGNPITGTGVFTFGGNKIAPRVTIGTGNMLPERGHLRLITELGFQYFSQPTVVYNVSGNGCTGYVGGIYTNCGPIPQSSILQEQNKLQNDLTDLRFFPILSIGLSYRIH